MGRLSKKSAKERIEDLRREIRRHAYLYYVKDKPEISDQEYDHLFDALKQLESNFPDLVTSDSPTQRIGAEPLEEFPTVEHSAPMLSLDATREESEVRRFDERAKKAGNDAHYIMEEKFDGASVELIYRHGVLEEAATRGDGYKGEDITQNVRTIHSVPLRLRDAETRPPSFVSIRGEVLMNVSDFDKLNRKLLAAGNTPFANPRNAAAGSLRQLDARITADRPLSLVTYEILSADGAKFKTDTEVIDSLKSWGFKIPSRVFVTDKVEEVIRRHSKWAEEREKLDYEIDGVVIKINEHQIREKLGNTSHHPRWAIAYKFEPRREKTRIQDIAVQVGRTGILTPVALMRPVEVGGVTVTRASLHNREEVKRKDVRIGDLVRIQRAGDVIPEVVERINERGRKRASHFKMPSKCPSCGTKVVERGPYTVCPNHFDCPAQLKGLIVHFTSREALDIENLGAETVATLIDRKLVKSLEDLFHLGANDFLQLEGFAERSAHQLFDAIQKSKRVELRRFLYGLGIPEIGAAVARDLADHFKSLDAVRHAGRQDFEEVSGIGPKMSESIHDFFEEKRRQQVIDGLLKAGVHVVEPAKRGKQPLSGKKFVFTGSLDQLTRSEAKKLVESLGARATSSVSGDTDYVVAGKDPGQKLDSAKEHGVNILNEKKFVNLVRGNSAQVHLHRG